MFETFFITVPFQFVLEFLKTTWWLWSFLILLPATRSLWLFWRQELFKNSTEWILLELRMPREIKKSPQAMEQVFASLHSLRNAPTDIKEKYWDGEVTRWFSLEMVSFGGEIHFYIRTSARYRGLVEAAFFSYYPDVEIEEVEDYSSKFPKDMGELYSENLDLWGTEMVLTRDEAYPIKSYHEFESPAEEKEFDPMSTFLETLGKLNKGEIVGIQILVAPKGSDWRDRWEKLVAKLKESSSKSALPSTLGGPDFIRSMRTPGESDVLEAVENNLSKPAFDTLIRFIYISPKELFFDSFARRGLVGAFNQYSALNLNSFRQNYTLSTRTRIWTWPHIFPKKRKWYRQERLLHNYRHREVPPETGMGRLITSYILNWNFASRRFAMNTEGLATLLHPPTYLVLTAPHMRRVESRKAGPPAGLAIYGEEGEIEKFK